MTSQKKSFVSLLQEFSIPLISGVFAALIAANVWPEWYAYVFGAGHEAPHPQLPWITIFGHHITPYFLINDIFMVFFFGIAAKEIAEACLPGGSLNPIKKAINPLIATLGGVVGPVAVFFGALALCTRADLFPDHDFAALQRGWGIPTATDIALAWLVARTVFGKGHPAINFLLLLAVADDAIGLGIIAIFYGDPNNPAEPIFLLLVLAAMVVAFGMRKAKVNSWVPYIAVAGPMAWSGLMLAHLHPALALVFVVPFLPGPKRDTGMFRDDDEVDQMGKENAHAVNAHHSPLHLFEHQLKRFVDFGLFFFAMGNAGVQLGGVGPMTWIILASLVVGKTLGVSLFSLVGVKLGFPLPNRMGLRELLVAGFIASLGLTVALFVSGAAFPVDLGMQGQAKMGALLSGLVGIAAIVIGRMLGVGKGGAQEASENTDGSGATGPMGMGDGTQEVRSMENNLPAPGAPLPNPGASMVTPRTADRG